LGTEDTLDTSVPGYHHGEISGRQLDWLADELATPAPDGTILALHHPPIPSVLDLAVTVELRGRRGRRATTAATRVHERQCHAVVGDQLGALDEENGLEGKRRSRAV
jgi:hypothetical protein